MATIHTLYVCVTYRGNHRRVAVYFRLHIRPTMVPQEEQKRLADIC
jgi:hypothetical protein